MSLLEADSELSSISWHARKCLTRFKALDKTLSESNADSVIQQSSADSLSRFMIWAGHVGAHHALTDTRSADYRLRDAPEIIDRLVEILQELEETLEDIDRVLVSELSPGESRNGPDSNHDTADLDVQSELHELVFCLPDLITSLLKISVLIRKATSRDRYAKASNSSEPFLSWFDIRHCYDLFPKLAQKPWLCERLGKAITTRRNFLRYCREHHKKLSHEPTVSKSTKRTIPAISGAEFTEPARHTIAHTESTLAPTKASTFNVDKFSSDALESLDLDDGDDQLSQISFVSSAGQGDEDSSHRVVPLETLSKTADVPFLCPYCYGMIQVKRQKSWRKHVYADIRPYVCTFEDCNTGIFEDRDSWFAHELKFHRRQWTCQSCANESRTFPEPKLLEAHTQNAHFFGELDAIAMKAVVKASSHPVAAVAAISACPFCDEWYERLKLDAQRRQISSDQTLVVTAEEVSSHLGKHMEQLALFAITPSFERGEASGSEKGSSHFELGKDDPYEVENWQLKVDDGEPEEALGQDHADVIAIPDVLESEPTTDSAHSHLKGRKVQLSDFETLNLENTARIAKDCLDKCENLADLLSTLHGSNPTTTAMEPIIRQLACHSLPSILSLISEYDRDEDSLENILDLNRALTAILLDCSGYLVAAEQCAQQVGHAFLKGTETINRLESHGELLATVIALTSVDSDEIAIDIATRLKYDVKQIATSLRTMHGQDQAASIDQESHRLKPFRQALELLREKQSGSSNIEELSRPTTKEHIEISDLKHDNRPSLGTSKRTSGITITIPVATPKANDTHPLSLMLSAARGDLHAVQSAIQAGFDINTAVSVGSLLCNCDGCDNFVNFAYNCKICNFDICERCRSSGLACKKALEGHTLERSSDINPQSTLLSIAVEEGHEDIVKFLLEHGSDPNSGGWLHSCVHNQRNKIAELLIQYGATVDAPGRLFGTALVAAAQKGDASLTKLLIEQGAKVNGNTISDDTNQLSRAAAGYKSPIIAAVMNNHLTVTKILLEAGADPNVEFGIDGTALDCALLCKNGFPRMEYKWHDIIALLKSYGAKSAVELKTITAATPKIVSGGKERADMQLLCPFEALQANQDAVLLPESELKQHIINSHVRIPFWRCDLCRPNDEPCDFRDPNQIAQHLHTMHNELVTTKYEYDRRYLRSTARPIPQSCGFCSESLADSLTWDRALDHIIIHIKYALSMRLPQEVLQDWQTDGSLYTWIKSERLHEIPAQVDVLARPYIKCVCGLKANEPLPYDDEHGSRLPFVACEGCGVLQHGRCVGVPPEKAGEPYMCEECTPRVLNDATQILSRVRLSPQDLSN